MRKKIVKNKKNSKYNNKDSLNKIKLNQIVKIYKNNNKIKLIKV